MKRILAVVMLCVFGIQVFACSVPDDPNWDNLVAAIDKAPEDNRHNASAWVSFHFLMKYLEEKFGEWPRWGDKTSADVSDSILRWDMFEIRCTSDSDEHPELTFVRSLDDTLTCMLNGASPIKAYVAFRDGTILPPPNMRSLSDCIRQFMNKSHDDMRRTTGSDDGDIDCQPQLAPDFKDAPLENLTDGDFASRDLAEELVKSQQKPGWAAWFGIAAGAAVDSIPEILVFICALADNPDHWSCPSSPLYPPGQTPQPGGDR